MEEEEEVVVVAEVFDLFGSDDCNCNSSGGGDSDLAGVDGAVI